MTILRYPPRYYLWRVECWGGLDAWEVWRLRGYADTRSRDDVRVATFNGPEARRRAQKRMDKLNLDWDRYLVLRSPSAPHSLCAFSP